MAITQSDLQDLTLEELNDARILILNEIERRQLIESIPAEVEELNRAYLAAEGVSPDESWRQPTGAHDAYPLDWPVERNGKIWISNVAGNVWEPGVTGWREQVAEGERAGWIQPLGAHDAYPFDAEVAHNGKNWISEIPNNVWEPGVRGWKEIKDTVPEEPEKPAEPSDPDNETPPETPEPPSYPEFKQPTGAHDAYKKDARVTFEGGVYQSEIDNNVYSPSAYPRGWKRIG